MKSQQYLKPRRKSLDADKNLGLGLLCCNQVEHQRAFPQPNHINPQYHRLSLNLRVSNTSRASIRTAQETPHFRTPTTQSSLVPAQGSHLDLHPGCRPPSDQLPPMSNEAMPLYPDCTSGSGTTRRNDASASVAVPDRLPECLA